MKRILITLGIICMLINAFTVEAQCSKDCTGHNKQVTKMKQKTLSCKLTSPELRKRKDEVIAKLKKHILTKKELPNGYSYKFNGTDEILDEVTAFVKSERQCCDFFDFKVTVTNDTFLWLDIYGPEGAKEFINTELELY